MIWKGDCCRLKPTLQRLAESPERGAVDSLHPDIQGPALSLGPVSRPLGQLQAGPDPGNRSQETLLSGRMVTGQELL